MSVYSTIFVWRDTDDNECMLSRHPYEKHYRLNVYDKDNNELLELLRPTDVVKAMAMDLGWLPMDRKWFKDITNWSKDRPVFINSEESNDRPDKHEKWWKKDEDIGQNS